MRPDHLPSAQGCPEFWPGPEGEGSQKAKKCSTDLRAEPPGAPANSWSLCPQAAQPHPAEGESERLHCHQAAAEHFIAGLLFSLHPNDPFYRSGDNAARGKSQSTPRLAAPGPGSYPMLSSAGGGPAQAGIGTLGCPMSRGQTIHLEGGRLLCRWQWGTEPQRFRA